MVWSTDQWVGCQIGPGTVGHGQGWAETQAQRRGAGRHGRPRGCVRGPEVCQGPSPPLPPQVRGNSGGQCPGLTPRLICHQLAALPPPTPAAPVLASDPWGAREVIHLSHTDSRPDTAFINSLMIVVPISSLIKISECNSFVFKGTYCIESN